MMTGPVAGCIQKIVFVASLLCVNAATGQTMYKCQLNGKIEYSDKPCVTGNEVKRIAPNGGPTAEDRGRAMMRLQAERERFDAQDRADAQARSESRATGSSAQTKDGAADSAAKRENEKVLIHSKDGWDRKPKGQIAAEEAAKQDARERARAGLGAAQPDPTSAKAGATWRDEKVLIHGRSGWDTQTRGAIVDAAPAREYKRERARIEAEANPNAVITSCDPGGCNDNFGRRYNGSGPTLTRMDGKVCQRSGQTVNCN